MKATAKKTAPKKAVLPVRVTDFESLVRFLLTRFAPVCSSRDISKSDLKQLARDIESRFRHATVTVTEGRAKVLGYSVPTLSLQVTIRHFATGTIVLEQLVDDLYFTSNIRWTAK